MVKMSPPSVWERGRVRRDKHVTKRRDRTASVRSPNNRLRPLL